MRHLLPKMRNQIKSFAAKCRDLRQLALLLHKHRIIMDRTSGLSHSIDETTADVKVPVLTFTGSSFECGRNYANWVLSERPEHTHRLQHSAWAGVVESDIKSLFLSRAKSAMEFSAGINAALGVQESNLQLDGSTRKPLHDSNTECTSFAVGPQHTLSRQPISGQTKDTGVASLGDYIVLVMRPRDNPPLAVLTYPGELLGYGLWGTGVSLFRNSIHSRAPSSEGLDFHQFGLLSLSQTTIAQIRLLASEIQIKGKGNFLFADKYGDAISIEFNAAGQNTIESRDAIITHANHCEGYLTSTQSHYPDSIEEENSFYRTEYLRTQLLAGSPTLTPQRIYAVLSDHTKYPRGICRHQIGESPFNRTTATVIAENSKMALHVSIGNPCQTWPQKVSLYH